MTSNPDGTVTMGIEELVNIKRALKWFEEWPEYKPNPDRMEECIADIKAARELLRRGGRVMLKSQEAAMKQFRKFWMTGVPQSMWPVAKAMDDEAIARGAPDPRRRFEYVHDTRYPPVRSNARTHSKLIAAAVICNI